MKAIESAACSTSLGTPAASRRRSISFHAIWARLGTVGSTLNPDSCSVTATIAQMLATLGAMSSADIAA